MTDETHFERLGYKGVTMKVHTMDYVRRCSCDDDDETPCPHIMEAEVEALDALVDAFAKEMKKKLRKKAREGQTGWDAPTWAKEHILAKLKQHVDKGDPVDIANLAAFLWNRQ